MARVNVYLPDDLAADVRDAGLNVSRVAQAALRDELAGRRAKEWLARARRLPRSRVGHDQVLEALDEVREESARHGPADRR